jgi:Tol biopolymer transport system component
VKIITSAFILAIAAGSCVPPGPVQLQSADDLEPALTQETMGRLGADRDPELPRGGSQLFYASTSHDSTYAIYAKTVGGNAATKIFSAPGDLRFPRINPAQNRTLAYCTNESGSWQVVVVADYLAAPDKKVVVSEPGTDSLHPSWSPDGKQLAFIRRPGTPFGQQAQAGTIVGVTGHPPAYRRSTATRLDAVDYRTLSRPGEL